MPLAAAKEESQGARTWRRHSNHGTVVVMASKLWTCWHSPETTVARPSNVAYGGAIGELLASTSLSTTALVLLRKQMQRICRGITRKEGGNELEILLFFV